MQIRVVLVSVVAAVLGLAAAVLGLAAHGANSKSFVGYDGRYCVYRSTAALGCGIAAAALLLTGQAALSAGSCCFGEARARANGRRRSVVVRMSAISWSLAVVATVMFLYGAWRNTSARRELTRGRYNSLYGCSVVKGGVFPSASALSVIACVCGIAAYVYQETPEPEPQPQVAGPAVAMAQPYFQPQAYPAMGYPYPAAPAPYGVKAPSGTA